MGVVEHLDYLVDLGIDAIYFNPIFQSASNHRYHTHDFYQVDPMLGGNKALRTLIDDAHRRNIRVVLDGVFNHASRGFFQFNDILENGPHSAWLDWFIVEDWPLHPYDGNKPANYVSWVGNRALPEFNTENAQVREYLMGIAEYWLREYDIDGWRLDVPFEIRTEGFWEEFRTRVKAIRPDAYTVGEVWGAAPEWLAGDRFDATMNYEFTAAVTAFSGGSRISQALVKDRPYNVYPGIDAAEFGRRIEALLALYNWNVTQVQLNLLNSHDTPRLLSVARGDKTALRLATLFQMTYPGAPCIYYGDEIALRGTEAYDEPHRDADARWAFPWHDRAVWDEAMRADFKALIALRKAHPTLRRGRFSQLYAERNVFVFARHDDQATLVIALNTATEPQTVPVAVSDYLENGTIPELLFGGGRSSSVEQGRLTVTIPARDGLVLSVKRET